MVPDEAGFTVMEAVPEEDNVAEPSAVVPDVKVTVPLGTALPEAGFTVAVMVLVAPTASVLGEAASTVDVATCGADTVTATAAEVEAAKPVPVGAMEAVMWFVPMDNFAPLTVSVAGCPVNGEVPSTVLPRENVTVPTACAGLTVALRTRDADCRMAGELTVSVIDVATGALTVTVTVAEEP